MHGLRPQRVEVPEHIRVFQMRLGVPLLRVDEAREENRVPNEKYWRVIAHEIPNPVLGVELHRETPGVSYGVRGSGLSAHGGEPHGDWGLLSDGGEHLGGAVLGDVVRDLEVTESSRALGVDDALGDPFAVEVGYFFDEVVVLDEHGAP